MYISEKTDTRLVLTDTQADKALAFHGLAFALAASALFLLWNGAWLPALVALALAVGMRWHLRRTRLLTTIVFDRAANSIHLTVAKASGAPETWDWAFSDLQTADVSTLHNGSRDNGYHRPDMILTDGTRVPMRPYHAAGTQSWHAVAAVKLFLDQPLENAPVGWLPPEAFDTHFADEMARLYKQ